MSKLLYASPTWYGFTSKEDRDRIDSFMKESSKSAFAPPDQTSFASLCEKLDDKMFKKVLMDGHHVLHRLLPPVNVTGQIFVVELIHTSYQQNAKLSYRIKTFLNGFSIKIHINGKILFVNNVLIEFRQTL